LRQARSPRRRPLTLQPATTLLWIDDYQPGLEVYRDVFEHLGFRVIAASHPRIGLAIAASQPIDAVITDYEMPDMDGAAVTAELKRHYPHLPVILFTGATSIPAQLRKRADAFCDKAEPLEKLLVAVKRLALKNSNLHLQPQPFRLSSEQGQPMVA
jgi:CheY-like chemotaxis protein